MPFVLFFLLVSLEAATASVHDGLTCENYSPCFCEVFQPYGLVIHCGNEFDDHQSVTTHDVQKVFSRTKAQHIYWLDLFLSPSPEIDSGDFINIPANFLSDKSVNRIGVGCARAAIGPLRLKIHPEAFRSSVHRMEHFEVDGCDLSRFNFNFLVKTNRLTSMSIGRSVHFQGFPPLNFLSRIISLRIYECLDFQNWNEISVRFPRLESLFLDGTQLGDLLVNDLLGSIASSPTGNDTLQQLSLWENKLTRIPDHVSSFKKLSYVNLFGNSILSFPKSSLAFHTGIRVTFLILTRNALETIESGAFQGDFSEAVVYLDVNHLTRFDSDVYENLLEQMYRSTSDAGLYVRNNPFACNDCHLTWLIRDKRHLLGRVHGGRCSNGTWFEDLNPEGYDRCS